MPPGPTFGWLCVLHSVTDIAVRAAQIRASQVLPTRPVVSPEFSFRKNKAEERQLKEQLATDAQATYEPQILRAFSIDPPLNTCLSHLDEQQVAPTLLSSRSGEQNASGQSSMTTYPPNFTEPILDTPLPDDPKLAASHTPFLVESSFKNASSREITLDSLSLLPGTEAQRHDIEISLPVDNEVRF